MKTIIVIFFCIFFLMHVLNLFCRQCGRCYETAVYNTVIKLLSCFSFYDFPSFRTNSCIKQSSSSPTQPQQTRTASHPIRRPWSVVGTRLEAGNFMCTAYSKGSEGAVILARGRHLEEVLFHEVQRRVS